MKQNDLVEGVDFYINPDGDIVLTESYHREKGYCCGMSCLHCPYNYEMFPNHASVVLASKNEKTS